MKTLNDLIDQVTDVDAKAKQESAGAMHPMLRSMMSRSEAFNNGIDLYRAGARSQARLGLALKLALDSIEGIESSMNENGVGVSYDAVRAEIRRILENKEGASE